MQTEKKENEEKFNCLIECNSQSNWSKLNLTRLIYSDCNDEIKANLNRLLLTKECNKIPNSTYNMPINQSERFYQDGLDFPKTQFGSRENAKNWSVPSSAGQNQDASSDSSSSYIEPETQSINSKNVTSFNINSNCEIIQQSITNYDLNSNYNSNFDMKYERSSKQTSQKSNGNILYNNKFHLPQHEDSSSPNGANHKSSFNLSYRHNDFNYYDTSSYTQQEKQGDLQQNYSESSSCDIEKHQSQQSFSYISGLYDAFNQESQGFIPQELKNTSIKKSIHIKKPLNAFMLFMKEMRAKVVAECTLKESAAINQILGRKWHALPRDEQSRYYEMARKEKEVHQKLYPGWSARDNYATHAKKKKRLRLNTRKEKNCPNNLQMLSNNSEFNDGKISKENINNCTNNNNINETMSQFYESPHEIPPLSWLQSATSDLNNRNGFHAFPEVPSNYQMNDLSSTPSTYWYGNSRESNVNTENLSFCNELQYSPIETPLIDSSSSSFCQKTTSFINNCQKYFQMNHPEMNSNMLMINEEKSNPDHQQSSGFIDQKLFTNKYSPDCFTIDHEQNLGNIMNNINQV